MALYHSTRSTANPCPSKQAIRRGIAADGGLFVSDDLPSCRVDISSLAAKSYSELAREILHALLPDFSPAEIASCVEAAYATAFASDDVTPVVALAPAESNSAAPLFALELYHGPTSAFKDIALQMLPHLMAHTGENEQCGRIHIVTATSGDTGKAALAGFADAPGCGITVFYPADKVSRVQELQMITQAGSNVSVCAVAGNFDDAQSAVKRIFADRALAKRLEQRGVMLSSANSINVGRLVPQVVYYFASYAQLLRSGTIHEGDQVEFCVPTGNFGDILAGYYAQRMGLPISKLLVASDKNNVLCDFLTTGTYNRKRPFFTTTSPSMDILVSSNLERMLYYASDGDCELVAHLMDRLAEGAYTVSPTLLARLQEIFGCGWANEDEVARAIRTCWDAHRYLIDPHTACAYHVLANTPASKHTAARIMLATASPYKFPRAVCHALGLYCPPNDFACMEILAKHTGTLVPEQLANLASAEIMHQDKISVDMMAAYVERAAL